MIKVNVRVIHVATGAADIGIIVTRLSPRFGRRTLLFEGFPLTPGTLAGLKVGQTGRLILVSATRPLELVIEDRSCWRAAPAPGSYHARMAFGSADRRRRKAIFSSHGLPDRGSAIAVARSDPPGISPGLTAAWRDVLITTIHPDRDELAWVWYPGDPGYGRDMSRIR